MFWTLCHELHILVINSLSLRCISWWSRQVDSHHIGSLLVGPKSSADPIWFVVCEFKGSGRLFFFLWHTFCNRKHCSLSKDAWFVNAFSMGTNELIIIIMSQGSVTLWYVFYCWFDVLCHFTVYSANITGWMYSIHKYDEPKFLKQNSVWLLVMLLQLFYSFDAWVFRVKSPPAFQNSGILSAATNEHLMMVAIPQKGTTLM